MADPETGTSADAGRTPTGDVKRAFDFSVSDFATVVTTTAYVDKSLMIRDVYNESSRILITAPPRFGKSTILDMIKRFFEIEVDASGNLKTVQTTRNYKLFQNNNLEICKDIGFFNEHFGKYPVLYIDFKPLGRVIDSANIYDAFKIIIMNSFNQHNYILQSSRATDVFNETTGFNETDFKNCVCGSYTPGTLNCLATRFLDLSTILQRFHEKKVFVLIDSYDAFLESPLCGQNTDRERMTSFVESIGGKLLNNENCVERVFITSVIPVVLEEFVSSKNNIEFYHFLDSHPFTKYYGLTSAEVDAVLSKLIECDKERDDVRNTINDYYNAYETCNREIRRVYNVWSVLQYVCRRAVKSYWCDHRYIAKVKKCFKIELIRQKLEELVICNKLVLDTSRSLSMKVNNMITSGESEHLSTEVELFFVLIYHFGYLSVINDLGMGVVCVNIPSEEIKYELVKAVIDENMQLYSSPHMNGILSNLDAFQPDSTDLDKNFGTMCINMYNWYLDNRFQSTYILERLFMNLIGNRKYSLVTECKLGPDGLAAVLLKNRHKVAICVVRDLKQSAERAHQKVTKDGGEEQIFDVFKHVRGKVIITVSYSESNVKIAYSYYFKTGDNLREIRTEEKHFTPVQCSNNPD